jgi:hypothetical protein
MRIYNVINDELNNCQIIWYDENGFRISFTNKDPANSDYQRYLRWLENPEAEENGTIS